MEELIVTYWPQVAILVGLAASWGDSRRQHAAHREVTSEGFRALREQLDKMDDRLGKAESRIIEHGERLAVHEAIERRHT